MGAEAEDQRYAIVMRMRGMYPADIGGYEAHRTRKGGDLSHVDSSRTHLNGKPLIGGENWAAEALDLIKEISLENHLAAVTALRSRRRKKEAERLLAEGPKDPWRPTRHGPLREIILTANRAWFEDGQAKFMGDDREADFQACARKWLTDNFGADIVHARADRDETTYHIHAILLPVETVEMTRTDKSTGETRVVATRRMLQPSKHDLVKSYEAAQDSVGKAFEHLHLRRGERRAEAIREARPEGREPPECRHHARTADWRAERELEIAQGRKDLATRKTEFDARETGLDNREAEVDAFEAAAEGLERGDFEIEPIDDEPDLMALPKPTDPTRQQQLASRMSAAPRGRQRAARVLSGLFGRLRKRARNEAEAQVARDVAEIRAAHETLQEVVSRLSGELVGGLAGARKSLVRNLAALRRHDTSVSQRRESPPDRD